MSTYTDSTGLTWTYILDASNNATIGNGSSSSVAAADLSGAITIPSTIPYGNGDASYNVTTINGRAFYQCSNLTSITIPDSVTSIGTYAFFYCTSLASIDLGDSVTTINDRVFYNCTSLTSIIIPDSVETIGTYAFFLCTSLTSIIIPDSVTSIGTNAFNYIASSSTVIVINTDPNKTMIEGLEYIGGPGRDHGSDGGLMDGNITGIVTYLSLTSTPFAPSLSNVSYAYDGTTKYSATISSMDLEGDNFTFSLSGADAASFQIDACNNALLESVNPWDLNAPFAYSLTIKATDSTDLSAISYVSIAKTATATDLSTNNISGSTLKTLADQFSVSPNDLYDAGYTVDQLVAAGFSYWNYTLDASNNATIGLGGWINRGNATFLGTSLSGAITIPSTITDGGVTYNVTGIGEYAFLLCTGLTSIDLSGTQVTTIGQSAFDGCTGLTSIDFSGTQVTTIGSSAFARCSGLDSVTLPTNPLFTNIRYGVFNECSSLTSITIPDSVTTIISPGETISRAFERCSSLTSIDIPNSVESIGDYAFYKCSGLTSITIPDSVTTIGLGAFNTIGSSSTVYVKDVDPTKTPLEGLEYIGGPGLDHGSDGGLMDGKITGTVTYQLDLTSTPFAPSLSNVSYAYDGTTKYSATISSMDLEGDNFTFSLSGADAASFQIDACNNALLESVNPWDLNAPFAYLFTIKATDSTDLSAISLVSIAKTVTATDLSTNNISGSNLKTLAEQYSLSAKDLYEAGYTLEDLYDAGYSATDVKSVVHTAVTVTITGADSYGDGWNGGKMTIANDNGFSHEFVVVGSTTTVEQTLPAGDYTVTWILGSYPHERSVTITSEDVPVLYTEATGGSVTNGSFTIVGGGGITSQQLADAGYDADALLAAGYTQAEVDATTFASATVPGCMDSNASNYDASATQDDGSCTSTAAQLFSLSLTGTALKTSADTYSITPQQLLAAGYTNQQLLDAGYVQSDICFVAGTPVNTDQGAVAIDKLDVSKHTIRGKRIVAVTKTISEEKHLVRIRKDALAKNVPSQDTLTTQNHCFFYNGNMVEAKHLVSQMDNAVLVKYDGSTLYNVLQDKHEKMVVNNLIAETLHPEHGIAKMYRYFIENNVSPEMQNAICAKVNSEYKKKNLTK